jgi:TRAP-type C4-dicarboxylate transport system substrate-binding protein
MRLGRRRVLQSLAGVLAAPAIVRTAFGQAAQVTLKLHHFLSPLSNAHARFLAPWAKQVASESGGRIKIDVFPAMTLGGSPAQLYDQARDGIADIVWTMPGHRPGRFPLLETFELPFVPSRNAFVNSQAVQDFAQQQALWNEFRDVHAICFCARDHAVLHSMRQVRTLEEVRGLKLQHPTRLAGEALKALGVHPIGVPLAQVPHALAQNVIDGCVLPWGVVPTLKLPETLRFHAEVAGPPALSTATFVLAMNKGKYNGLPADLRAVLDRNSGQAAAMMAGRMWDNEGIATAETVKGRGNTVAVLSPDEAARWRKATQPVIEAWMRQVKERGADGGRLLETARALLAKHEKG